MEIKESKKKKRKVAKVNITLPLKKNNTMVESDDLGQPACQFYSSSNTAVDESSGVVISSCQYNSSTHKSSKTESMHSVQTGNSGQLTQDEPKVNCLKDKSSIGKLESTGFKKISLMAGASLQPSLSQSSNRRTIRERSQPKLQQLKSLTLASLDDPVELEDEFPQLTSFALMRGQLGPNFY